MELPHCEDGGIRDRRRRTNRNTTRPAIKASKANPPTTPPAIAPAFDFFGVELFASVGVVVGGDMVVYIVEKVGVVEVAGKVFDAVLAGGELAVDSGASAYCE